MGLPAPYAQSRPLEIAELELDPPGRGELLVRVRAAGLCHSDLSVIDGSRPRVMPMVLGHEAAGEVVEAGSGVEGFAEGDHVVLAFVPTCGDCGPCRAGRAALCEPGAAANTAGTLLSGARRWHPASGGGEELHHHLGVSAFAEHIVVAAESAVRVDDDLPFDVAALFGCAVLTGVGAAMNSAHVQVGDSVAVFGLGGVGLAALLGAHVAGAGRLIGVDVVPEKLELARALGATDVVPAGEDAVEAVRELTGGGVDAAIETWAASGCWPRPTPPRGAAGRRSRRPAPSLAHAVDPRRQPRWPRSARCAARTWAPACRRATCRASSSSSARAACRSTACSPTASRSTSSTRASTGWRAARPCARPSCSSGADDPPDLGAGGHAELAEEVAHVRLDGLEARAERSQAAGASPARERRATRRPSLRSSVSTTSTVAAAVASSEP
jgi:Zn-dependent alcohol dehydrogenase